MSTYAYLVAGVIAVDAVILIAFYFYLRSHPRAAADRRAMPSVAIGMMGFVAHALIFFRGALLVIQLVMVAAIVGLFWLAAPKHRAISDS
jgi:hypothetical protein